MKKKSTNFLEKNSIARKLAELDVPWVLGWGLAVNDTGATKMAAQIYKNLAMGKNIAEATFEARLHLREDYHPWPLLRVYADNSPLTPLISPVRVQQWQAFRKQRYELLQNHRIATREEGFVGRRREMQKGIALLRGEEDQYGLLITGAAGVGKSCFVGKLLERFSEKELLLFHGEFSLKDFFQKLEGLLVLREQFEGIQILQSSDLPEEKIKALFRQIFTEFPFLFYFDDFETNLHRKQNSQQDCFEVKEELLSCMKALLQALPWWLFGTTTWVVFGII